jgi:nucleotidyltransferase/DNA polymerase involved in DNA repair
MSNRMIKILQTFTPDVGAYSIDKSFLDLSPLPSSPVQHLRNESTTPIINILVTIGIASTKTLETESSLKQRASYIWIIGRALAPKLKKAWFIYGT